MKAANAQYIISHIGAKGLMPELSSKNRITTMRPGFYHGSCSFVQFIADNYGLNVLLTCHFFIWNENESIEADHR